MAVENIRGAIEAILFANGASVEFSRIAQALEISEKKVKEHISALIDDYEASGRGITIVLLDNSCQMVSKKEFAPQIRTVMDLRRNTPLTKAFVEQVRGVDCSGVIGSLTTKGLVEEKGRLELPGRPLLYGTTENFLRCFNISSLDELPPLPESDEDKESEENGEEQEKTENGNEQIDLLADQPVDRQ